MFFCSFFFAGTPKGPEEPGVPGQRQRPLLARQVHGGSRAAEFCSQAVYRRGHIHVGRRTHLHLTILLSRASLRTVFLKAQLLPRSRTEEGGRLCMRGRYVCKRRVGASYNMYVPMQSVPTGFSWYRGHPSTDGVRSRQTSLSSVDGVVDAVNCSSMIRKEKKTQSERTRRRRKKSIRQTSSQTGGF